jgi:hypothetical protein
LKLVVQDLAADVLVTSSVVCSTAVFEAYKALEVAIREAAGLPARMPT